MKVMIMIGLLIGTAVLNTVTLFLLWGWIVAPVFALAPLTIGQSYGLAVVVGFFLAGVAKKEIDPVKSVSDMVLLVVSKSIARSVTFLLLGFVASFFV
jgi:hypothetical protein